MCGLHCMNVQTCIAELALRVRYHAMRNILPQLLLYVQIVITAILYFFCVVKSLPSSITHPCKHTALYYRRPRSIRCSDAYTPNGLMIHESSFHIICKGQQTNFQIYLGKYAQAKGASKHFQDLIHMCQVVTHRKAE